MLHLPSERFAEKSMFVTPRHCFMYQATSLPPFWNGLLPGLWIALSSGRSPRDLLSLTIGGLHLNAGRTPARSPCPSPTPGCSCAGPSSACQPTLLRSCAPTSAMPTLPPWISWMPGYPCGFPFRTAITASPSPLRPSPISSASTWVALRWVPSGTPRTLECGDHSLPDPRAAPGPWLGSRCLSGRACGHRLPAARMV